MCKWPHAHFCLKRQKPGPRKRKLHLWFQVIAVPNLRNSGKFKFGVSIYTIRSISFCFNKCLMDAVSPNASMLLLSHNNTDAWQPWRLHPCWCPCWGSLKTMLQWPQLGKIQTETACCKWNFNCCKFFMIKREMLIFKLTSFVYSRRHCFRRCGHNLSSPNNCSDFLKNIPQNFGRIYCSHCSLCCLCCQQSRHMHACITQHKRSDSASATAGFFGCRHQHAVLLQLVVRMQLLLPHMDLNQFSRGWQSRIN